MKVGTATMLRRTCIGCGGTKRQVFWAELERLHVIARCCDCGVNFHGEGIAVPSLWARQSGRGLEMEVDPKAVRGG